MRIVLTNPVSNFTITSVEVDEDTLGSFLVSLTEGKNDHFILQSEGGNKNIIHKSLMNQFVVTIIGLPNEQAA